MRNISFFYWFLDAVSKVILKESIGKAFMLSDQTMKKCEIFPCTSIYMHYVVIVIEGIQSDFNYVQFVFKKTQLQTYLKLSFLPLPVFGASLAFTKCRAPQLHCTKRHAPATKTAFQELRNRESWNFTPG